MWGQIIGSVAGSLLGGMFGKDANENNAAAQEAFAQHGIRWKVADAKAAGLHPLYALGGSGAAFTPSSQPIFTAAEGAQMGQNIGRAVDASNDESRLRNAQLSLVEAQKRKTDMETQALASDIARQQQAANIAHPVATSYPVHMPGAPTGTSLGEINPDGSWMVSAPRPLTDNWRDLVNVPDYMTSSKGAPFLQPYNVPGLGQILLPSEKGAEALESLENTPNQVLIAVMNLEHLDRTGATKATRLKVKEFLKRRLGLSGTILENLGYPSP